MSPTRFFTSESVCAGHPDKICDQISDAIVDAVLVQDPLGRVAVETLVTTNQVVLAGEVHTTAVVDFAEVARHTIRRLGYTDPGFDFTDQSPVMVLIHHQSPEIAQGVEAEGAGDQGMMFGYACRQTDALMPLPIMLAHQLAQSLDTARETKTLPYLRPDGKTQVTISYQGHQAVGLERLVIAIPHQEAVPLAQVKADVSRVVIEPLIATTSLAFSPKNLIINGTGCWHLGGPAADTGLTGRKIVVDTYGGYARVGGGCFSGKDATKVDRSGAYLARFLAKNMVAQGLADEAEVGLAFCIGQPRPVMTQIEAFGTAKKSPKIMRSFVDGLIDITVQNTIEFLQLWQPIFEKTAAYGHFGREEFAWERVG